MVIFGIGIDITEIDRIEKILIRNESSFIKKIFTDKEIERIPQGTKRKYEFVAGRFAAKEAVAKALGTGIGGELSWQDIEIIANEKGRPIVFLNQEKWRKENFMIHLSISHSQTMAIAKVIIEEI